MQGDFTVIKSPYAQTPRMTRNKSCRRPPKCAENRIRFTAP